MAEIKIEEDSGQKKSPNLKVVNCQLTIDEKNKALSFTDFYLKTSKTFETSFLYYPNRTKPLKINEKWIPLFTGLIKQVKLHYEMYKKREDFIVKFQGRSFRACAIKTTVEGLVFALRQTSPDFKDLTHLNIPRHIIDELLHERLKRGGLVLVGGAAGNGKTTTSSALVVKRLERFGGLCITIEDPPELYLNGHHGMGTCIQTKVKDEGWDVSIKTSMRAYPTGQNGMMFVGEVRDPETAVEVLKASIDGRLVIATLHGGSVYTTIKRIAALAYTKLGEEAFTLLGESFRLAIHQKFIHTKGKDQFAVEVRCLVNSTACVNHIKNNDFDQLRNQMEMQAKKWEVKKKVSYHVEK